MSAIGGFAQGLAMGRESRQAKSRSKAIDALLEQKATTALNADVGAYEDHLTEGGDPDNWVRQETQDDPFIAKAFYKMREMFGGQGAPEQGPSAYDTAYDAYAAKPTALPGNTMSVAPNAMTPERMFNTPQGVTGYADGGRIRSYADGGRVEEMEDEGNADLIAGGALGAYIASPTVRKGVSKVAGGATRAVKGAIPLIRKGANTAAGRLGGAVAGGVAAAKQTRTDYDEYNNERFRFDTKDDGEMSPLGFGKWAARRVAGFAADVADTATFGGSTALSDKLTGANQKPTAIPTEEAPDAVTAATEEAVGEKGTPPAAEVAKQAVQSGVQQQPGNPEHPDQQIDFAELAANGLKPDEIPNVPVKEWNDYRKRRVLAGLKQGRSVGEVNAEVDQLQHAGFMRNAQQASFLAMSGDKKGAALALRAAYQYFPNGSDIRFTTQQGKDGQEYVVGLGYDEESGKVVGQPQLMTPEYMNAMIANFENPQAFNTWKKDQDTKLELEKKYKAERPQREANLALTLAQAKNQTAAAGRQDAEAQYARSGKGNSGSSGRKESDKRAAGARFDEVLAEIHMENPGTKHQLNSVMSELYNAGLEADTIANEVWKVYTQANEAGQDGEAAVTDWYLKIQEDFKRRQSEQAE